MIRSTFEQLKPYSRWFFFSMLVFTVAFNVWIERSKDFPEVIPGGKTPDMIWQGASPLQLREWHERVLANESFASTFRTLALLDLLGIIPAYVLWLGTALLDAPTEAPAWFGHACYMPIYTASFDLLETLTHYAAIGWGWKPSSFWLLVASVATQAKHLFLILSILLVMGRWWMTARSSTATPTKQE